MVVAIWNYRTITQSLVAMEGVLGVPASFKRRWLYSYVLVLAAVLVLIGFVALLFMLRAL